MTGIDHLVALRDYQEQFLATIPLVDPDTPVPWCGRWRVRDLVTHLAGIHYWAAGKASGLLHDRDLATPPADHELAGCYAEAAAHLRGVLASLDPEARCWTLLDDGVPESEQVGTVRFWHRRQALETLVHLWDLHTAGGLPFVPEPAAWLDCLDEVITVMHPRQLRLNRIVPPLVRVRLVAADVDADYVLDRSPDEPTVSVSGPIRSLALLAWGRVPTSDADLVIEGDLTGLARVVAAGLTP